ncbi:hypothetical protein [Butyrivibrio sp. YAB3001]|uniref:hypothetical protein n=1 Tax=Butyrivibrio sp. YAB3001 TaxID=1520812 RepID=UPI0008F641FF|nr:hypothetical protein [Butyrivibrio sp. YAB3001]SFC25988.1 hypothetical protein SAMN02910398_01827 [Butyrivibrio sp. YAB3001]
MKKSFLRKVTSLALITVMSGAVLAGCGSAHTENRSDDEVAVQAETGEAENATPEIVETEIPLADAPSKVPGAPYFTKGVYANYAEELENPTKHYFYVFNEETYGYTADGDNNGIGLPFGVEQTDGSVKFFFGGEGDGEGNLIITAVDNGVVHGYFEDIPERALVFEPVAGADADSFSAENYVNGAAESVYHNANGWSVKYDADLFEITQENNKVAIVYSGEGAGTNMVFVVYDVDMNGEQARDEFAKGYGAKANTYEQNFPGTTDVIGYWAELASSGEGSGLYEYVVTRDYMGGYLAFEVTGHDCGDDTVDKPIHDLLTAIIDSITFE